MLKCTGTHKIKPACPCVHSALSLLGLAEAAARLAPDLLASPASQDGWTPLYAASFDGHSEVVDRLLAARAMVDAADKVRVAAMSPELHGALTYIYIYYLLHLTTINFNFS